MTEESLVPQIDLAEYFHIEFQIVTLVFLEHLFKVFLDLFCINALFSLDLRFVIVVEVVPQLALSVDLESVLLLNDGPLALHVAIVLLDRRIGIAGS